MDATELMQELMQKDLESLIKSYPAGIQLILRFDDSTGDYLLFFALNNADGSSSGNVQQIFTQRKKPKTFKDISRALEWGRTQGFASVTFEHSWKRQATATE